MHIIPYTMFEAALMIPGAILAILIAVLAIVIFIKIIKAVIGLAILIGIVLVAWKLGLFSTFGI